MKGTMMNTLIKNAKTQEVLRKFGWSPDRRIDTSAWLDECRRHGMESFPIAEVTLANLGGLEIRFEEDEDGPFDLLEFTPPSYQVRGCVYWRKQSGLQLFPLGEIDVQAVLLVSDVGEWYVGHGCLWKVGEDADDALTNLLFGTKRGVEIWRPPLPQ